MSITPAHLAEWRRIIRDEGALHSALAQRIAPQLMDEIERAWAEIQQARREVAVQEVAELKRRLAEASPASAVAARPAAGRRRGSS